MRNYIFSSTIGLLVLILVQYFTFSHSTTDLKIYFLDVGQGDSILLKYPTGEKILVDTGKDSKVFRALDSILPWYDKNIDYVLLTHSDLDHVGAMIDILDRYSVKKLFINNFFEQEEIGKEIVSKSKQKGTEVQILKKDDQLVFGSSISNTFKIINPKDNCFVIYKNTNDCSLVGLVNYGSTTVLLTGDISKEVELQILPSISSSIDILKVAHHGSKYSTDEKFIQTIKPTYSIISVGENKYGHPSAEALATLRVASSTINNTKKDATIVASSDGNEFKVEKLFDQSRFFQSSICSILLYSFDTPC